MRLFRVATILCLVAICGCGDTIPQATQEMPMPPSCDPVAGSFDPTFDSDGIAIAGLTGISGGAAIQPDGKIVVSGRMGNDFVVARFNSTGSLDGTFNGDGRTITSFGGVAASNPSLVIQGDGRIVIGGMQNIAGGQFALVRYDANGDLDTTFDGDGQLVTNLTPGNEVLLALALQADGKILAAGHSGVTGASHITVVRYDASGALDPTFDTDGIVSTPVGTFSQAAALAVQPDGKIVVGGNSSDEFVAVRYNADGSLDTTFDGDGIATVSVGADDRVGDMALQPDGRILLAGFLDFDAIALARLEADGSLDPTFQGGTVTTSLGDFSGGELALLGDGRIAVVGRSDGDLVVALYTSDGLLDDTFGACGRTITDLGTSDFASDVLVQATGELLVPASTSGNIVALRFLAP